MRCLLSLFFLALASLAGAQSAPPAILRGAQSPTIAASFLKDLKKPSDADVRSLVRFLDSPDPRLHHAFVKRLAVWYGEAGPEEPREERDPDGEFRTVYPGLDTAVAYWKARLKGL